MADLTEFKKLAAKAKDDASIEQLVFYREKAAARLVFAKKSGVLPQRFIAEIENSISEYDRRIKTRLSRLAVLAKSVMTKQAAAAGL